MESDDDIEMEAEDYKNDTLALLRSEKLIVQNGDGTLRCPHSPSKKKQSYPYKDLLQHATAVAEGKRGPEAVGKHSALKEYLENDLLFLATPPVERLHRVQHEAPQRRESEELLVCPWSVVIHNIESHEDRNVGPGKAELKSFYAQFKPEKVHIFWGPNGHLGMSVLQFGRDFSGLKNAQALDKIFLDNEHGRREYDKNLACDNLGKEFYGWLARNEDFRGRPGHGGAEVGKYLRTHGNLMDIEMMETDMKKIHEQLVHKLTETVCDKNEESHFLRTEIANIRRKAHDERLQLEESHKQELDAIRFNAQKSEEEYNKVISESNRALQEKEAELHQRDKELQELSSSIGDVNLLETEKMENQKQQEVLARQQDFQRQLQTDKMKLIQQHEEENRKLVTKMHHMNLALVNKQKKEMERYQLQGILEAEKAIQKLTIKDNGETAAEDNIVGDSRKVEELEKKLEELASEKEYTDDTLNIMIQQERKSTDENVQARKEAAIVLLKFSKATKLSIEAALAKKKEIEANSKKKADADSEVDPVPKVVGVKWAGSIEKGPWKPAWQKRHKICSDWALKMSVALSEWEERIKDPEFQAFKMVNCGEDKWERVVDPANKELSFLKSEYGDEVYNSVIAALKEIADYNPSGGYPVPFPWILDESRMASLKEVISYLGAVIMALTINKPRKRARP